VERGGWGAADADNWAVESWEVPQSRAVALLGRIIRVVEPWQMPQFPAVGPRPVR
jgi:hypothetical protein